jgi:hypothetical protein
MQGHRLSMNDDRITQPENLPRPFSNQKATAADVGFTCPLMHDVAKLSTWEKPEPLTR